MSSEANQDLALMERIVQREQAAFAELYDLYSSRVFGLLLKILNNRSDAEEVLQETFWQVWNSAEKFDQTRSSPRVWLFLLARSRAIDHYRRKPTAQACANDLSHHASDPSTPEIELRETSQQVRDALDDLPEEQAVSIRLAFYEGLTHTQVAERLEVPLGTVKTRIRSGVIKLQTILRGVSA